MTERGDVPDDVLVREGGGVIRSGVSAEKVLYTLKDFLLQYQVSPEGTNALPVFSKRDKEESVAIWFLLVTNHTIVTHSATQILNSRTRWANAWIEIQHWTASV